MASTMEREDLAPMTAPRLISAKASTFIVTFGLGLTLVWIVVGAIDVAGSGMPALAVRPATDRGGLLYLRCRHGRVRRGCRLARLEIDSLPFATAAFMGFAWAPFIAICLGENSPVALLCVMVAAFGVVRRNEALAGAGLGLLLYKPSDAVAVGFLLLVLRQWRALAIALALAAGW